MIKEYNGEWIATIEQWYEEVLGINEKGWVLEAVTRNFFGKNIRDLTRTLLGALDYQAFMFVMEDNPEATRKRQLNMDNLQDAILEIVERPMN